MADFFYFHRWIRIGIGMIGAIAVIFQAMNIALTAKRMQEDNYRIRQIFEYAVLLNILVLATIPPMLNFLLRDGFLADSILEKTRVGAFVCLLGIALIRLTTVQGIAPWFNVVVLVPTLPFFEKENGKVFFIYLTLLLIYFLLRGIWFIRYNYIKIQNTISVWSVKEALDSLRSGILFCTSDGSVLLTNRRMQHLIAQSGENAYRNGLLWFTRIGKEAEKVEGLNQEDQFVLKMKDRYWHFSKDCLMIRKKDYWQITSTDITEQWNLLHQLEDQNRLLNNRSMELNHMINNMFQIQRDQEKNHLRAKLHDLLSQRITLFQRWMQSDVLPTPEQISDLIETLKVGLNAEVEEYSADNLQTVIRHFREIGIKIYISGELPQERLFAGTFILIIREATTNAVRHGFAQEVFIDFGENEEEYVLTVRNDGIDTSEEIQYGNGLRIMQERLNKVGGVLKVETIPSFLLTAIIPKEKKK